MEIKPDQILFNRWVVLAADVTSLGAVVLMDAERCKADLADWVNRLDHARDDFVELSTDTMDHLLPEDPSLGDV